ncbi:beta-ketoacyl-[acyl-carrier-protein] synthase family protein [Dyadobacter tibetensis]|uniref:beta-ketoacyl-[acyl-carrier-protein] synthase family protein n=1 Tax=Dyadobacter tibetensis TaxID=1211851 RepID=UPI00046F1F09|nr:beta-ketoacyl-[acyl-carrier-protein] synthase family protein [Dyadobacter tibetensis]
MKINITGLGVISAIGHTVSENLQSLIAGRSGIGPLGTSPETMGLLVGAVNLTDRELMDQNHLSDGYYSRSTLLGLTAAREAWEGQQPSALLRTGFISATSVGGMDRTEVVYEKYLHGEAIDYGVFLTHDSGYTSEVISKELGISGYVNTISTACSSAANAIMMGARLLRQGKLDRVLVGGMDPLTHFTVNGFKSLLIYDDQACRPFDDSRAGLNLGEGAAYLVLENEKSLQVTGNEPICQLTGWANAADAYHQTASSPEGKGATLAIQKALDCAGIAAGKVSYINVHGTGTRNNDLSESMAMKTVFGDKVPPFSSTKAYTGHTLAAAGSIEAVFSVLAIRDGLLFPNLNFTNPLAETGLTPVTMLQTQQPVEVVLSNSFGFGGNNSSLIFARNE